MKAEKNKIKVLKILNKWFKQFEKPTIRRTSEETKNPFKVLI